MNQKETELRVKAAIKATIERETCGMVTLNRFVDQSIQYLRDEFDKASRSDQKTYIIWPKRVAAGYEHTDEGPTPKSGPITDGKNRILELTLKYYTDRNKERYPVVR